MKVDSVNDDQLFSSWGGRIDLNNVVSTRCNAIASKSEEEWKYSWKIHPDVVVCVLSEIKMSEKRK